MSRPTFFVLLTLLLAPPVQAREKSVKEYAEALKHSDVRVRVAGLSGLASAGAEAAPFADAIARLLKDPSIQVRRAAAQVLANLGPDAEKAAPALASALRDSDPAVKLGAGKALVDLGEKAIPALKDALADRDSSVRFWAVLVLEGMAAENPGVVKALGAALKDSNPMVRKVALAAMTKLAEPGEEVVDGLARAIFDKDVVIRSVAALTLLEMKKAAAMPYLLKALKDASAPVRFTALQALGSLSEEMDRDGMLALRSALTDEDAKVRQAAALSVAKAGVKARELGEGKKIVDPLFKLMKDKNVFCRQAAIVALGSVGIDEKEEIAALAEGLKDKEPLVRHLTVQSLAQYTHEDAPADWRQFVLTFIADALQDKDKRVQFVAASVLVGEKEHSVPALARLVETAAGATRIAAAQVLAEIGPAATAAVPALRKMSREGSADNRQAALFALQKIQP